MRHVMKIMKTAALTLPAFWASALINNEWSGLEPADADILKAWLGEANDLGPCLSCTDTPFFTWAHAASPSVLATDCLEFTFPLRQHSHI